MGRRLILVRHAKSSWADPGQADHARPLNARGRTDTPRIAARIVELGWTPESVWTSDARRTRETCDLLCAAFDPAPSVTLDHGLYLGDLDSIRTSAAEWDDALHTVMAIGHNPGWSDAASMLAGTPLGLTTANAVLLERDGARGDGGDDGDDGADETWADALLERWRLVDLLRPKEL